MYRIGLAALIFLTAQLKVDVGLVNVVATVMDERGRYVADLTPEDFILHEDGQSQTISHLTQSMDIPVSMGVVLDTSGSMERKIRTATEAVERFIEEIHPKDEIFLMTFADRVILRQDFTSSRAALARALRMVTVGGGTALYDGLEESLLKIRAGFHDKKAILLLSDGQDTTSESELFHVERRARESEVLIYCLGISPSSTNVPMTERLPIPTRNPFPGPLPMPRLPAPNDPRVPPRQPSPLEDSVDMRVLNGLADTTGGKAFLIERLDQINKPLDEIAAELRNQYSIGYYPSHPLKDGKFHRIEIKTKNPKYYVRARKDYYGG